MSKDNRRVTVENAVSGKIEKPWLFLEKCSTYWWEYYSVEFKCNFPSKIFVDNVGRWCYDIVSTEKDIRKRQQNFIRRLFRFCTHETRAFFFPPEKLAPRRFSTNALRSSTNYLKLNSIFPWNSTSKIISNRKEKRKMKQSRAERSRTKKNASSRIFRSRWPFAEKTALRTVARTPRAGSPRHRQRVLSAISFAIFRCPWRNRGICRQVFANVRVNFARPRSVPPCNPS